ncbi:acyltransferase family protein [Bacillus badius]|uniref:acyltransferase family protein n=1 Tax=Bacillus badius TaxID=1455 RepID=UPI002E21D7BD|nr:acyltransferase family protein [Bacillus badius]MED0665968.1 acyltransferase family protein [Bacillus badius]
MNKNQLVPELFILRSVACLSVVLLHALTSTIVHFHPDEDTAGTVLRTIQLLLLYSTPLFVFIAEFLNAYNYREKVPANFFKKRIQFIFVPYVVMGCFYAVYTEFANGTAAIFAKMLKNVLLGDYHGYFVLIIFQFYLLHVVFFRIQQRFSPRWVLIAAFVINAAYLSVFNFIDPPAIPYGGLIWNRLSWLPFIGWLFYFVLGYYAGAYYGAFKEWVAARQPLLFASWLLSGALLVALNHFGVIEGMSSKRVDVLLFTTATVLFGFSLCMKVRRLPKAVILISTYSFGIYLLHPLFQNLTYRLLESGHVPAPRQLVLLIGLFFATGTLLSMLAMYLLNKLPFGKYAVGKIGPVPKEKRPVPASAGQSV